MHWFPKRVKSWDSDGTGLWNQVSVTRNQCEKWVELELNKVFFFAKSLSLLIIFIKWRGLKATQNTLKNSSKIWQKLKKRSVQLDSFLTLIFGHRTLISEIQSITISWFYPFWKSVQRLPEIKYVSSFFSNKTLYLLDFDI